MYLPIFECPKRARQLRSGPTQAFSAQHSTHSWKCHRLGPCGTLLACNPRCPPPPTSNHSPHSDYPPLLKNRILNKQTKNGFGWFWCLMNCEEEWGKGWVWFGSVTLSGWWNWKKKKKRRGIRVFECFLSCREIKGIVLWLLFKKKGNKKLKKESGCWFVVRVFLYM